MPWITLPNGELLYKVSLYAKEELPTWSEVYEECFLKGLLFYNSDHPHQQELDPYWKLPRLKVLLATVCNQMNKMLFEDGYRKGVLQALSKDCGEWGEVIDIRFLLEPIPDLFEKVEKEGVSSQEEFDTIYDGHLNKWAEFLDGKFVGSSSPPPIYTIPNPNGTPNPFITNKHPRIDISELQGELQLYPIIKRDNGTTDTINSSIELYYPLDEDDYMRAQYKKIMSIMMQQYKSYFSGVPGWKDIDGNPIDQSKIKADQVFHMMVGRDPAL